MTRIGLFLPLFLLAACVDEPGIPGGGRDSAVTDLGADLGMDAGLIDAESMDTGEPSAPKRVFVTQARFNGNLGGLTGADEKCQTEADNASLDGSYRAWLSTPAQNAVQRMSETGPWRLVDEQTVIFADRAAFEDGPASPIDKSADGQTVTGAVWTGTLEDGTVGEDTCQSWTSGFTADFALVGGSNQTGSAWTHTATLTCSGSASLFCFEQ